MIYEKNLASQTLPFGPRCLRNFGKIPSTPAALPFFTSFKDSTSSILKSSIHSDFSTQLFNTYLRSFFIFSFSSCDGFMFDVLKRVFEIWIGDILCYFHNGWAAHNFLSRDQFSLLECVKSISLIFSNHLYFRSSSSMQTSLVTVT